MVPVGVLPCASRRAGVSMPWSTLLRIMWTRGSPISSMMALSTRVPSPSRISSISLPWLLREVAHQAGEALEHGPDGQHPDVHDRLLELGGDAGHVLHGGDQLAGPLVPGQALRRLPAELLQLGAVDDELAHQVQQVVELGEVHAHHAGARGHVLGCRPLREAARRRRSGRRSQRRGAAAAAGAACAAGRPPRPPASRAVQGRASPAPGRASPFPLVAACSTASRRALAPANRRSNSGGGQRRPAVAHAGRTRPPGGGRSP